MDKQFRFFEYHSYIKTCVKQVQDEMALGNVDSQEALFQIAEMESVIWSSQQAFELFDQHAPYEWSDQVTEELCRSLKYNLADIAWSVANQTVLNDVLEELLETASYRFLNGGSLKTSIFFRGKKIVFEEQWRSSVRSYDYIAPLEITTHNGRELSLYQEGEDEPVIFVLDHADPALTWVSSQILPFDESILSTLQSLSKTIFHGSNQVKVWDIKSLEMIHVDTIKDLQNHFGLHPYLYAICKVDKGNLQDCVGFNTIEEFHPLCDSLNDWK